ncbi:MAG: ATP-binding cassette domain-containing protein [Mogibacterium sp.]|nr:ATP-binding cassette domain-containing protein [Mogibacterium sp.]
MRITELRKKVGKTDLYIEDLKIESGMIHGLVGPNGCGKTTLLKLIMGITEPDSGMVDLEGLEPTDITMMSQRPYLMHADVYDNIVYPLKIRGEKIDVKKIDELLERVGLLDIKDQYAGSLSSGERQKLSFLRAIVFKPKMILMDETLSNLDQESEALFKEMILERHREDGSTWLIVSHQWDEMNDLFDRVHHMEKGRIVEK